MDSDRSGEYAGNQDPPSAASADVVAGSFRFLYFGIKAILRCDEAEVVEGIARYAVSQHRLLRWLVFLIERGHNSWFPALIALIGGARAFLSVQSTRNSSGTIWHARLSNERRALEPLVSLAPDLNWTESKFRALPDPRTLAQLLKNNHWRRITRLVRQLHRRDQFFKVLRVVEFIAFYSRYLDIFERSAFRLAVMSSHSNPHGVAFNLAARKCGVPVALITHGMPVRPVARLTCDLAVVHCEAARQTYLEEGCQFGYILIHGRKQNYSPMLDQVSSSLAVAIFLCKDVNDARLESLVSNLLRDPKLARINIRPHPKNLSIGLEKRIRSLNDPRVGLSTAASSFADVRGADLVLGGNSSVLIEAVVGGRPAGFVSGLDHGPPDLHRLVDAGLICSFDETERGLAEQAAAMLEWYRRPEWETRLRHFANIDADDTLVASRAVEILRELSNKTDATAKVTSGR
jgi:hypothetical protein